MEIDDKLATILAENESFKNAIKNQKNEIFKLKKVIENLPASVYWKDRQGRYLGRNRFAAEKMREVGLEQTVDVDDVIGKTDFDLYPEAAALEYRKNDEYVMESGESISSEESITLASGETLTQISTKTPLKDVTGAIIGVIGNTVDITYLKKIEAELRKAKELAEEASQIKIQFMRNMEHDIRTPFAGILGMGNYLLQIETSPHKIECLQDIVSCTKELLDYCNSILEFSRIQQSVEPIVAESFDLGKLVHDITLVETPAAKHKGLKLTTTIAPDVPATLVGDRYRLYRILINLLSNSIKFTPSGHVELNITLDSKTNESQYVINFLVSDTGIGIENDKKKYIFEMFSRGTPSNRTPYTGLGLGLRIVKQFVDEMAGSIKLLESKQLGTQFLITLPFLVDRR